MNLRRAKLFLPLALMIWGVAITHAAETNSLIWQADRDRVSADIRPLPFGRKTVRTVGVVSGGAADMIDQAAEQGLDYEAAAKTMVQKLGVARFGTPAEIAQAVAFLASSAASYCQGTIMDVDGGETRTL